MSSVYLAYQPSMDRVVAIKVLPRVFLHDDTFLYRFQQEVRTIARLEHLHILPVYDVGEDQGLPYFVMRYLSGGTLADLIAARLPSLSTIVRVVTQVAGALDYAHERGIIHRDLKPSNVLLDTGGNVYLADFGIARVQEAASVTTGSHIIGTPPYIAPEMVRTGEEVTGSVDTYALGVITYEMLTGEPPYFDDDPMKTLMAHVLEPVPSVQSFDPNISDAVDEVVRRCLAKRPEDRYRTAGEFARELTRAAEGAYPTVQAPATGTRQPSSRARPSDAPSYVEYRVGEPAEARPRLAGSGCLVPLGVLAMLLAGIIITALIVTGGHPLSLLAIFTPGPEITPQATATDLTPELTPTLPTPTDPPTEQPSETPVVETPGRLAFASDRDGDFEIFLINADGSDLVQLTSNASADFAPAWSPDGSQIVFTSTTDGDAEIKVMNADGSGVRQITDNAAADTAPSWSPDGAWIAFASNRGGTYDVWIMRPDGSDVRQVTESPVDALGPTWSADGRRIGYYVRVNNNSDTTDLYVIELASGAVTRLTANTVLDQWLEWSPDGLRLAFDSDRDSGTRFDLYVLDLATGELRQITSDNADNIEPAWQPGS
jgi:serine/threonine protein kinase